MTNMNETKWSPVFIGVFILKQWHYLVAFLVAQYLIVLAAASTCSRRASWTWVPALGALAKGSDLEKVGKCFASSPSSLSL